MRFDPVAHHRRNQGEFHNALRGTQPPQAHGCLQRFGTTRPLLTVDNAAQCLTLLALAGTLTAPSAQTRMLPSGTERGAHPALLPGAGATGAGGGYTAVDLAEPVAQAANAAAAGCLLRPRSCPSLLVGAAITAVGSLSAGAWIGWEAARRHGSCGADETAAPVAASLSAAAQGSEAAQSLRNDSTAGSSRTAGFLPTDLDPAHDPCTSLYAYVNARWANATVIPDHHSRWHIPGVLEGRAMVQQRRLAERLATLDHPTAAERVVADLWASGMDVSHVNSDRLRPLRGELASIAALDTRAAVVSHLRVLTGKGRNPLFGLAVEPDMDNRTVQIPYVIQGGLGLPSMDYYRVTDDDPVLQSYQAYVERLLLLSGVSPEQARHDAEGVVVLEQRLAAASASWEELRAEITHAYNPLELAEADRLTPHFTWSGLFEAIGVPAPARISVATPDFFRELDVALAVTDLADWRAYLRFHCLDQASAYLDDNFVQAAHDFQQQLANIDRPLPPRWKRVLAAIDAHAGQAMGEAYVTAHFPAQTKARIEQMVAQMRGALKHRLGTVPWLDDSTRLTAQAKAEQLNPRIGHPDQWPDWSELRTERCGYLRNLRLVRAFQQRAMLARIGQPPDPSRWRLNAHAVNAYFDVMNNDMTFPAALLQPPYFDPEADDALNYGAVGAIIGHEMCHAFSAETSRFALDGTLRSWWSDEDLRRYRALSRQLATQFDAQEIDGLAVNGTLTAHENMADLGGLRLALDALQAQSGGRPDPMLDGLSREQRFFISWAVINRRLQTPRLLQLELALETHAIGAPRVDVAPSNMPAFAEAFNCPPGAPMTRSTTDRVSYL